HSDRGHGIPHLDRSRPAEDRHGVGDDRRRRADRVSVLRARRRRRAPGHVLARLLSREGGLSFSPHAIVLRRGDGEILFNSREKKMKSIMFAIAGAAAIAATTMAHADDKVTLQLKWVTQAQFAGYYVAKDKGFYKEEGLDVTIKPGGPDVAPEQVLVGGGADVVVDWMPAAL